MPFATVTEYEGRLFHIALAGSPAIQEFKAFLQQLGNIIESRVPFTLFIDTSQIENMGMKFVQPTVSWLKINRSRIPGVLKASAIYIEQDFIRGLLQLVFKMQPPVSPNLVTNDAQEAVDFLDNHS
ncbi:MAG: hypothetical protein K0U52_08015 [Gammaproteobacteria bacterium]|nr:hypothetical protein [Gammaproteobacteria bacterium]